MAIAEPRAVIDTDLRLKCVSTTMILGGSGSGKTRWALYLLTHPELFKDPPERIVLYYSQPQDGYAEAKQELREKHGIELLLYQGFDPDLTLEKIQRSGKRTLAVFDDLTDETFSSPNIAQMTMASRHRNVGTMFLLHTLFHKSPASRIMTTNCHQFFFLPSIRMSAQIKTFASQIGMRNRVCSAYKDAVEVSEDPKLNEHRYLFLDLFPSREDLLRVRSRIHLPIQICWA